MKKTVKEKRCPKCGRIYVDETLNYCLADGSFLYFPGELEANATGGETEILENSFDEAGVKTEAAVIPARETAAPTEVLEIPTEVRNSVPTLVIPKTEAYLPRKILPESDAAQPKESLKLSQIAVFVGILVGSLIAIYFIRQALSDTPTNAALPAVNKNTLTNAANTAVLAANRNSSNVTVTTSNVTANSNNSSMKTMTSPTPSETTGSHDDPRIAGTTWKIGAGIDKYTAVFLSDGTWEYYSNGERQYGTDTWTVEGDKLTYYVNDKYSSCEGIIKEKRISLDCRNENDIKWKLNAIRIK
ncbi:MAG TPA: hypothetical protein VGC76_16195 [Pyrinomonadaceae bacterium]|jgi:hypothetical protein